MKNGMLSRRAALKAMGSAPLAMLLGAAGGASAQKPPGSQEPGLVPPEDDADLRDHILPKARAKKPDLDGARYKRVAYALWVCFKDGVAFYNAQNTPVVRIQGHLLRSLYETMAADGSVVTYTGSRLVETYTSFDGEFGNNVARETAVCAFKCGHLAAARAAARPDRMIKEADYNAAWTEVKDAFYAILERRSGDDGIEAQGGGC